MRLKIDLYKENFNVPIGYNHILQGTIYNMLNYDSDGAFYHDVGYQVDDKIYKMFVFSNLFGSYTIQNKSMTFKDKFCFYVSAMDDYLIERIYEYCSSHKYLTTLNQKVMIKDIHILKENRIQGVEKVWIKTLSPISVYSTQDDFTTYYSPIQEEFEQLIRRNLLNKVYAYDLNYQQEVFEILEVKNVKERMVKYKDCFYKAYHLKMKIEVSPNLLHLIYNSGISSKGSCGFGMIEVCHEKNDLSI